MGKTTGVNLDLSLRMENYLKQYVRETVIPYRFLNYDRLVKLSKCIGLIGPRGSCKSLTAAAMGIIDYLIPGYELISNMEIKWALKLADYIVGYRSTELDQAEFLNFDTRDNVAVMIDEVNIEFSEARRSSTNRNLIFNKILQQLRKKKMNLVYTVQHEMWVDNRLRYQTDFFIRCQDICLKPGGIYLPFEFGEFATWTIYDMSGFLGQGSYQETNKPVIENWKVPTKKWWGCYDTSLIQGEEQQSYGRVQGDEISLQRSEYIVKQEENVATVMDTIKSLHDDGIELIKTNVLYDLLGIKTQKGKIYVGKILKDMGIKYQTWNKSFKIPTADLNKPETMRVPKEVINA